MTDTDPADKPTSFAIQLQRQIFRFVVAVFGHDQVAAQSAVCDLLAADPLLPIGVCLPAIRYALDALRDGTPMVANQGVAALREMLADTREHAEDDEAADTMCASSKPPEEWLDGWS